MFAQSSVSIVPITANYSATPPTVTFEVSWPGGSRDADHHSKIWLLVDYRRIKDNAYTGGWLRAGISSAHTPTATAGSTVSLVPGNTKGFWLQGTDGAFAFAATVTVPVTVDLTGYASQFAWCGVASDRPPTAIEYPGYYALQGTKDFIIQTHPTDAGQTITESTNAYIGCIYSLTDSTGCPGEAPAMPAITNFTASRTAICVGESATLTATAANAERYSFDNGANWGSSSSTVVSPTSATTYILKATREKGACTVTFPTQITITVNDPPTPHLLTAAPDVICAGEAATLTASATDAASYSLTGNGTDWQADADFVVTPAASTYYTLYVKNADGCTATKANAATVTVNDLPVVASVSGATACAGKTAELTATLSGGTTSAMTYSWDIGGTPHTTFDPMLTTQTLDVNTAFTVTVTNANGCISEQKTDTISVTSPATAGQAVNACNCAAGLLDCLGTCEASCCTNCASWTTCA